MTALAAEQMREMAIDNAIMGAAAAAGSAADGPSLCDRLSLRQAIAAVAEPGTPAFPAAVQEAVRGALGPAAGQVPVPEPSAGDPPADPVVPEPGAGGAEPEGLSGEQLAAMTDVEVLEAAAAGGLEAFGIGARSHGPKPGLHPRLTNEELAARGSRSALLTRDYAGEIGDQEIRDASPAVVEHWRRTGRLTHLGVGRRPGRGEGR